MRGSFLWKSSRFPMGEGEGRVRELWRPGGRPIDSFPPRRKPSIASVLGALRGQGKRGSCRSLSQKGEKRMKAKLAKE